MKLSAVLIGFLVLFLSACGAEEPPTCSGLNSTQGIPIVSAESCAVICKAAEDGGCEGNGNIDNLRGG